MGCSTSQLDAAEVHFHDKYSLGEELGHGCYGIVQSAVRIADSVDVAVKVISREGISEEDEASIREEFRILSTVVSHPSIIKALDFFETTHYFYVVLERVNGGELIDKIAEMEKYNESDARDVAICVLEGLKHIHKKNVVHRDIKPQNLLLVNKDDMKHVKIIDFGFAQQLADSASSCSEPCGSLIFMAPEILRGETYAKACDMWSFGVLLYQLMCGNVPFLHANPKKLARRIVKGELLFPEHLWSEVSDEAKDLICHLLTVHPQQRFTADDALRHPWMRSEKNFLRGRSLRIVSIELQKVLRRSPRFILTGNKSVTTKLSPMDTQDLLTALKKDIADFHQLSQLPPSISSVAINTAEEIELSHNNFTKPSCTTATLVDHNTILVQTEEPATSSSGVYTTRLSSMSSSTSHDTDNRSPVYNIELVSSNEIWD